MAGEQNAGSIVYEVSADVAPLLQGGRQASKALEQMEGSLNRSVDQFKKLDTQVSATAKGVSGGLRNGFQQAGYQIQDFIVQVQGGQSALVAFSQQGSQLAGAFGPGGAVLGAVIALSTVIAGTLISSLNGGKSAIDSLKDAAEEMDKVITISQSGVAALSDKYANLARTNAQVATLLRNQTILEYNQAIAKISKAISDASDSFISFGTKITSALGGGYASIEGFNDRLAALNITTKSYSEASNQASSAGSAFSASANAINNTVGALADKLGISQQQAFELAKQLSDLSKNPSPQALQELATKLQAMTSSSKEGQTAITELLGPIIQLAGESANAAFNLDRLKESTDNLTEGQKSLIRQSERNLALSKLQGEARARLQAQYAAEDAGFAKDDPHAKRMQDDAAATYANTEAQRKLASEQKKGASTQESIAQKLEKLRQESLLAGDTTGQLAREQQILNAKLSLGPSATEAQRKQAAAYKAEALDTADALKKQEQAEKDKQNTEKAYQNVRSQSSPLVAADNTYQQQMASLNAYAQLYPQKIAEVEQTRASIEEQYRQQRLAAMWEEWQQQSEINQLSAAAIDSLQSGGTNAITGLINGTQSLQEAFANIGTTILGSVVSGLVQMGLEWVKSQIMGQAAAAASLASTMAQATAAASAWAPAAISASIATYGSAAAVGQTAYAGSLLAAKGMAVAGAREHGGPVSANSMYRVGEGGKPEIYQANNGSQYMIPGDNGRVISNRDMQKGGGGGSSIVQNINFEINTTGGIDDATMSKMAQMMKQVSLNTIRDQQRPNGLLNRGK